VFVLFKEAYFYAGWLLVTSRCASRGSGPGLWDPSRSVGVLAWSHLRSRCWGAGLYQWLRFQEKV